MESKLNNIACSICVAIIVFCFSLLSVVIIKVNQNNVKNNSIQLIAKENIPEDSVYIVDDNTDHYLMSKLTHKIMAQYDIDYTEARQIVNNIIQKADEHNLDYVTAFAIVNMESDFNHRAERNGRGNDVSKGLTQVTSLCLQEYNNKANRHSYSFEDMLDVENALEVGFWYLSFLQDKYDYIKSEVDAIIAYNLGPTKFSRLSAEDRQSYNSRRNRILNDWSLFFRYL